MRVVEISAKTIDEAIQEGLQQLGLSSKDEVEYEILEYPSKGILGLMSKPAKIIVKEIFNPAKEVKKYLADILKSFNVSYDLEIEDLVDCIKVKVTGDDLAILIGKYGKTIDALQYLLSLSVNRKTEDYIKILLDINGYREKREQTLGNLANRQAQRAKSLNKRIYLEPMNAMERRIIHSVLNEDPEIETFSEGEEPFRRIVIEPIR